MLLDISWLLSEDVKFTMKDELCCPDLHRTSWSAGLHGQDLRGGVMLGRTPEIAAPGGSSFSARVLYSPQSTKLESLAMFLSSVPVRTKAKVHIALHPARHPAPAWPHRRQQLVIDQRQAAQVRVRERQGRRLLHIHCATQLLFLPLGTHRCSSSLLCQPCRYHVTPMACNQYDWHIFLMKVVMHRQRCVQRACPPAGQLVCQLLHTRLLAASLSIATKAMTSLPDYFPWWRRYVYGYGLFEVLLIL